MKATFKKLEPGSKINIWILGRKAEAIFEKYIEESGEVTFTHKGRDVTLDVDIFFKDRERRKSPSSCTDKALVQDDRSRRETRRI